MSARVNLLPREIEERARTRRTTSLTIGAVLLFAALLGVIYIAKLGALNDARQDRNEAEAVVQERQARLAQLQRFAELDRKVNARNQLLAAAMATEISWARVFNDLALTFPASSSLEQLRATAAGAGDTGESGQPAADVGRSIASMEFNGYSVERYAPGVERVLLKLSDVDMFFNTYLATASAEAPARNEKTDFQGSLQLNKQARTDRYIEGLPQEPGQ